AFHNPRLLSASPLLDSPVLELSGIALSLSLSSRNPAHMGPRFPSTQAPLSRSPPSAPHPRARFRDRGPPGAAGRERSDGRHGRAARCLSPPLRAGRFHAPAPHRPAIRAGLRG